MKFSVIIPVDNSWEYLREGVDSALGQTGADFEILLVDDGSTDGESGALCDTLAREHPDCIRVLHKPNGGAGDARNVALPLAQGDYVLFLDSDDTYTPDAFAVLRAALDETQADVCYFGLRMTGDNDGAVFTDDLPLHTPLTLQETPALLLNRPSACIAAWRRTLFTDTGIRFRARGWGEDLCMTRKMLTAAQSVVILPDVLRLIYCFGKLHIWVSFRNFDGAVLKDIAVFSGFIAINMVVDQVNNNLDKLIITRYCGTAATAVYAVGQQLHTYFISFSTAVSSVFTPRIHQLVQDNKDDKARLRTVLTELFVRVGRIQFLILSLVCTGIIFFGKPFIYFWAGPGYDDAYIIVLLLIIPGMVPLTQNLGIEMQRAQNLHKYRSIIYGAMAIGNLAISIWLCQYLGAIGCAIGTAVAVALANGLVMNIFYQRRLNIDVTVFWKNIGRMTLGLLPPAACGVLMMLFVNLYSIPMLLGGIIIYTAIYCASVWLLSMNGYEKALVGGMVRKVLRK